MKITVGSWEQTITPMTSERGTYLLYVVVLDTGDNTRMTGALAKGFARNAQESDLYLYRLPTGGRAAHITVVCCR